MHYKKKFFRIVRRNENYINLFISRFNFPFISRIFVILIYIYNIFTFAKFLLFQHIKNIVILPFVSFAIFTSPQFYSILSIAFYSDIREKHR